MEIEQIFKTTNSGKFLYIGDLVRCKDCKYAKEWNVNTIRCRINSNDLNAFHRANWFCADGEKRTEV